MTTHKKSTSAEKHKTSARKTAKPTPGQTMDIIPKNRIRPHTTSRPVIPNGPLVQDNSMTSISSAPTLRVKRHNLTIDPLKGSELTKEDVFVNSATAAATASHPAQSTAPTVGKGVSVEELIAKRGAKVIAPGDEFNAETDDDAEAEPDVKPAEEANTSDENSVPKAKNPWEEFNQPDESPIAETANKPQEESTVAAASSPDDAAAAEAAQLLAGTPVPHRTIAELEATHSSTRRTPEPAAEPEPEADADNQQDYLQALTQSSHQDEPSEVAPPEVAAGDSLADALREDEPEAPQEHSQALKDAMQEMSDKDSTDRDGKLSKDEKSDGHHELYGGKPVIIVHSGQGQMSAVAWVLWFIFCLGLALVIVNFLIDAGYIETNYNIPHTNIISK